MKNELIHTLTESFEGHAQQTDNGVEFWLARDIQHLLGYTKWDNFLNVISKAKTACEVSSHDIADHFADVGKMVELGSGSQRDTALYGKNTKAMKAHWQVPDNRPLADFAPTIILKAKDFATEITIHNARERAMSREPQISQEHVTNNQAVRQTLIDRGIRPESLPPAEDLKKVERRLTSAEKKAIDNPDGLEEQ